MKKGKIDEVVKARRVWGVTRDGTVSFGLLGSSETEISPERARKLLQEKLHPEKE